MTNNPTKRAGIEGYGLSIVEQVPLSIEANEENRDYLRTKASRLGPPDGSGDRGMIRVVEGSEVRRRPSRSASRWPTGTRGSPIVSCREPSIASRRWKSTEITVLRVPGALELAGRGQDPDRPRLRRGDCHRHGGQGRHRSLRDRGPRIHRRDRPCCARDAGSRSETPSSRSTTIDRRWSASG